MSNYYLKPLTILPSIATQEAREKRRKVLESVRQRRKIIYQRFRYNIQRHLQQESGDVI